MAVITLKGLKEQRAASFKELGELNDKLNGDAGNEELRTQFEAKETEVRGIDEQIARFKRMDSLMPSGGDDTVGGAGNEERTAKVEKDDICINVPEEYDILRAIRSQIDGVRLDGLEGEISQELAKRYGKDPDGFFLPMNVRVANLGAEQRDFDTTAGSGGIATIKSRTFIELLRNRMLLNRLGARTLTGLRGDLSIPKMTGAGQAYWVTEGNAPTESNQTIGQVPLSPNTCGAYTDVTRKLLKQNSRDANAIVLDDLNQVLRLELDRVGFNGSGAGAEPEGLLQNGSVSTVSIGTNGGALTWAKTVEMETAVANQNADVASMHYVSTPLVCGHAKTKEKFAGTNGNPIWSEMGTMNGYSAHRTKQLPDNLSKGSGTNLSAMLFGDFSTLLLGFWGGIDVMVDPYSLSTAGGVRIVLLVDTDVQLRHTESVSKCVDIDTSA